MVALYSGDFKRYFRPNMTVLLIDFFLLKGILRYELFPRGETVNKQFYLNVLKRLMEAVRRKRPEAWTNNTWMRHHDDAPANAPFLTREILMTHETTVVPQPPFSPDLAPADFFFFPKFKSSLKGRRFQTVEEIEENSIGTLAQSRKTRSRTHSRTGKKVGRGVSRVEGSTLKETSSIML